MLRSVGEIGKYVTATEASTYVSVGSYRECETLQLLYWLSVEEYDKGRGRIISLHSINWLDL